MWYSAGNILPFKKIMIRYRQKGLQTLKILFLEPFFGGSHQDFALGLKACSIHDITLETLPARFWKWRMRGAALYFVNRIKDFSAYDAVMTTDMMDLTDFKALAGKHLPPVLLYFHENQLSYPLAFDEKRDFHLGFTNIVSAFAADRVVFNSKFHLDEFMGAARALIKLMPDARPGFMMEEIRKKASVLYPGCRFEPGSVPLEERDEAVPLIIWNHRWEHDKNPESFFNALFRLKEMKVPFSLVLLGENFEAFPDIFNRAKAVLKDEIRVSGYVESREDYLSWLKKGAVVVSTALQENFGISVVEAVRHGCIPLLPRRLSYPEIMPGDLHPKILYKSEEDLVEKLTHILLNVHKYKPLRERLSADMARFSWEIIVKQYDKVLKRL
jgi:glycosyltransferase involved in cell wall biosynthesis